MSKQTERVLKYMCDFGSITSAEAIEDLGVYRLASRISDIRKSGIEVFDRYESSRNRYGETVSFKRYSLEPLR